MDTLKDFRYTMESCNHCGQCKWILAPKMRGWDFAEICPIHERYGFDAYSGQGLLNIARELADGRLQYEQGMIDLIYSCTACGACDVNCKSVRDMEVQDTILALRAECAANGQIPQAHKDMAKRVAEHHNIYALPREERGAWAKGNIASSDIVSGDGDPEADTVYFAGCASSYKHPEIARDTVRILQAGGVKFKILGSEEHCCGGPLWRTGQTEAAEKLIEENIKLWRKLSIRRIITSCAECYGMFRSGYPRFVDMDIEVVHISEIAADLINKGKLKLKPVPETRVCYHDACMLGRLSEKYVPWNGVIKSYGIHEPPKVWRRGTTGCYEPPREVLRAIPGVSLVEAVRNKENAYCCGAGGGAGNALTGFALWAAGERMREVKSVDAQTIVSCCPFCGDNFETARHTGDEPKHVEFVNLLASALA